MPEESESIDWVDLGIDADAESGVDTPGGKTDGPRRRRRRRGRRRDRTGPAPGVPATGGTLPAPDLDLDDDEADDDAPRPSCAASAPPRPAKPLPSHTPDDDLDLAFDFDDEDAGHFDDDEGDDIEVRVASPEDDMIDPGLEEEIRREIEEIAELEREMGLRGTTEARPRRGDERDAGPGGRGRPASRPRPGSKPPIQEIFRRGDEVLVQVIKESIGTKGPTLSTYISIPGRYLVLMPGLNRVGVSRKIADEGQRRKLREIMNDLNPPQGPRASSSAPPASNAPRRELARDLAYLLAALEGHAPPHQEVARPSPIYQESDMITRTIRDIFTSEIDTIWIDEPQAFERAQEFLQVVMPQFVNRLKLYDETVPLFHKYGIEDEIAKIQRRHVQMPEGGSIVIDQTEALVAIDVNSGNFRVENDAERTAYEMNLRAAKEIARQLRLRDLGGVIVNDFIDMRDERHRRGVERALRDAIQRDRARTKVLRMSAVRPHRNDPPADPAEPQALGLRGLPPLRRRGRRQDSGEHVDRRHATAGLGVAPRGHPPRQRDRRHPSGDVPEQPQAQRHRPDRNRVQHDDPDPRRGEAAGRASPDRCFDAHNTEIRLLPAPPPTSHGRRPQGH